MKKHMWALTFTIQTIYQCFPSSWEFDPVSSSIFHSSQPLNHYWLNFRPVLHMKISDFESILIIYLETTQFYWKEAWYDRNRQYHLKFLATSQVRGNLLTLLTVCRWIKFIVFRSKHFLKFYSLYDQILRTLPHLKS
jgi:hypothetical protein